MRIWNPKLLRYVGVVIFLYLIFFQVGIVELFQRIGSMNLWILLLVFPINWLQWGVRALRWRILLRNEGIEIPLLENYVVGCASIMFGVATPGRLGEFIKVKFIMNAGHTLRGAFLSSFIERLFDLGTLIIFVTFGIAVCLPLLPRQLYTYAAIFILFLAGCFGLFLLRRRIQTKFLGMLPETLSGNVEEKLGMFKQSVKQITIGQWFGLTAYSLAVWGLNYFMIYLLYLSTGNSIAIHYAFAFAAIGSFAGLIPLSIFGIGIREPVFIGLFTMLGYGLEQATDESVLFGLMFMVLLLYHIITGFLCWMSPVIQPYLGDMDS